MKEYNYTKKHDRIPGLLFQTIFRLPVLVVLKIFFKLKIEGLENLQKFDKRAVIVAANHTHELDGFIIPASIPMWSFFRPFHPVTASRGFYKNKGLRGVLYDHGFLFYIMGAFPVYTKMSNYVMSLKNQINILKDNGVVLIFPEGRVVKDTPRKPKIGAGYLSLHTQIPIVPIYVSREMFNRSLIIGEPIYPKTDINENDIIEEADRLSNLIYDNIYSLQTRDNKYR